MTGNTDSLSATPSEWPNNPNRPVEKVSWADAQIFLTRLNAQQSANIPAGWAYVLPTESQWEYACRAGTTTMYSWGNDINAQRANYSESSAILARLVMWAICGQPVGLFRYAWKCVGVDRGLVPGGLSHRQPGGGSQRTGIGLARVIGVVPGAAAGRTCVLLSATRTPSNRYSTSASVLVSNSSSKWREEA